MSLEFPPSCSNSKPRPRPFSTLLSLACAMSMLGACEDPAEEDDGGSENGDDDAGDANVVLENGNNYSNESTLTIPSVETVEGDFEICWGDIMQDIQCHDVDPVEDIDAVALLSLIISQEEAEEKLASDTLTGEDRDGYIDVHNPTDTCIQADDLTAFGTEVDIEEYYLEMENHSFLLLFNTGTQAGVGARTMTFVQPRAASTNSQVNMPESSCDILDFSANLQDADPVSIPADGPWLVSWANVTENGAGNEFIYEEVDGLLIGFYEGLTVADLEEKILDLEQEDTYTAMWDLEITSGRSADLADAVQRGGGDTFEGFEGGEGTWLLGLMCSTCSNPAPLFLAVLDPSGGGE